MKLTLFFVTFLGMIASADAIFFGLFCTILGIGCDDEPAPAPTAPAPTAPTGPAPVAAPTAPVAPAPTAPPPPPPSNLYFSVLNNAQNEHFNCNAKNGSGSAVGFLATNGTFCIRLSYTGLSTPELFSHIHGPAPVGGIGPVIFLLEPTPTKIKCYDFNATTVTWLNQGLLYFNIHSNTTNCSAGEIRGQILRSA